MLYEIHMLKNYPPTNLNRDENGAPKTCLFGGVNRGRISSQCLKRTWRTSSVFQQEIGAENLGVRTRKLPDLVGDKLLEMGVPENYVELVVPKISGFGTKEGTENKKGSYTAQVIFFGPQDIQAAAEAVKGILDRCKNEKEVKALKGKDLQAAVSGVKDRAVTLDIALFGRMVTSDAFRDVEASMQVAHAISTNKVAVESDYFTAMDDLLRGETADESGAAMIGDIDYNSSCYYIYASLDTDVLKENLKDAENADEIIAKAVPALLRTMAFTNPSGKQNSFAGHVLPGAVLVECKNTKIPTSMVNAFVEPVRGGGRDLLGNSVERLAREVDSISEEFGLPVEKRLWFCVDKYDMAPQCEVQICKTFPELVNAVAETMC